MANTAVLDFNADQGSGGAWEPRRHVDSTAAPIAWQAASVRQGATDISELYQADERGNIFQAELSSTDDGAGVSLTAASKRMPLGMVSLLHSLYLRAEAVSDTITVTVTAGGAEYGEVSHTYTVSLAGTGDKEVKIRLHRDLVGVWAQVTLGGAVSHRPAVREMRLAYIPIRMGRYSA